MHVCAFTPFPLPNTHAQIPANLIVTRDFIEFVESKARIEKSEFVGITTVKNASSPMPVRPHRVPSSCKQSTHAPTLMIPKNVPSALLNSAGRRPQHQRGRGRPRGRGGQLAVHLEQEQCGSAAAVPGRDRHAADAAPAHRAVARRGGVSPPGQGCSSKLQPCREGRPPCSPFARPSGFPDRPRAAAAVAAAAAGTRGTTRGSRTRRTLWLRSAWWSGR